MKPIEEHDREYYANLEVEELQQMEKLWEMSGKVQKKLEVIIYADDEILIQDIILEIKSDYNPVLRVPSKDELEKILKACNESRKRHSMENVKN